MPIFHLHGAIFGNRSGIVITESDYLTFRERRRMLFDVLKHRFATSPILYVGYSHQDPNWKLVWAELVEEFLPSTPPVSYRVSPATDPLDLEILKAKGLETIAVDFSEFCALASAALSESEIDYARLKVVKSAVPSQLHSAFEKTPAAVARLLTSWTYVNQAPFNEQANVSSFLWGDRPNWSLVASKKHFTRDVEENVCDDVLDVLTGTPTAPTFVLALGPAGYGITTLLMSAAVRLIQEGAATVFMHRPGTQLNEGDVIFAASLTKQPTVFLVDDAADYAGAVQGAVTHLRTSKIAAVFILGEHLNEWRQRRASISGREHVLEPLSDTEIGRLLDCLVAHHALNKIAHLQRDVQVAVIREKHGKELLVAMKEATEGLGFDAILEGEFRGIESAFARSVYLAVACSYQHGAYLRDNVLATMVGTSVLDLYANTKGVLDGVVLYDCIDEAAGIYAARTRHRKIAEIIWERCGDVADKDRMLQLAIANLNLNYRADVNAFEHFIRSDRLVDRIRTLEGRIQFFETACRKDPSSPYVRQHYARMLSRAKKPDLALAQIDAGFKVRETAPPRVLFHTKGVILAQLAFETESEAIARRRLVQAEEAYRKAMSLNPRDEYTYQGLASLYLGWAKRVTTETEATDYVAKAEDVISDGLRKVKERDGLWILTAEIQKWLGNKPSHVKALEIATASSPGSVIARYLLARTYRTNGNPEKAIAVLEPVIKSHQDEYRSFIEYGLALLELGKPIADAIAILNISTTYGMSDARFVATLGGMLFIAGDHEGAAKIFRESLRREFPYAEATTIHFRPQVPGVGPLQLRGKITTVRPNYVLIQVEGYPNFICPKSKFGSIQLSVGAAVQFNVEFSAKGQVATSLTLI